MQLAVLRAEIVPPLRNAMSLIDNAEVDRRSHTESANGVPERTVREGS